MTAEAIARELRGRRCGAGWMARCPAHRDRSPSLSIRDADGKILVHCLSGCDQHRVIDALRARGLWPEPERRTWTPEERRQWAQAQQEARALVEWRDTMTEGLRYVRDLCLAAYHRARRHIQQHGLDGPDSSFAADVTDFYEERYQELDKTIQAFEAAPWSTILKLFRESKRRAA